LLGGHWSHCKSRSTELGVAKEIWQRAAPPIQNGSTSEETDVLLDPGIDECFCLLKRHFDRQLREARIFARWQAVACEFANDPCTHFFLAVQILTPGSLFESTCSTPSPYIDILSIRRLPELYRFNVYRNKMHLHTRLTEDRHLPDAQDKNSTKFQDQSQWLRPHLSEGKGSGGSAS
jgi:hypothetical protein